MVIVTKTPHQYTRVHTSNIQVHTSTYKAAEREGGQQLAPGPKQEGAPNLRNILKLNKASSKSGRLQGINGCIKTLTAAFRGILNQRFGVLSTGF